MTHSVEVGFVVIGRNEGERLKACLAAIPAGAPCVYVDSGSSDDSVAYARGRGVLVVELDLAIPFTAARARNAGLALLLAQHPALAFIQMIDGDCMLDPAWLPAALAALEQEPQLAAVFGRRRERFPERSFYNRLCDDEWNVPIGLVDSCGGDALFRVDPLRAAGGYREALIAGEEPDLCLRLRNAGWSIRRIDAEMTLHDAALIRFAQWWRRAVRSGHAYAEHCWVHRSGAIPAWRRQVASIVVWGGVLPVVAVVLVVAGAGGWLPKPYALIVPMLYLAQWGRIATRRRSSGASTAHAARYALLMLVGKFAEMRGMLKLLASKVGRRQSRLIEYKGGAR